MSGVPRAPVWQVNGDAACCVQCNLRVPEQQARQSWWYEPAKNRWKLRKRQEQRKQKRRLRALAAATPLTVGATSDAVSP